MRGKVIVLQWLFLFLFTVQFRKKLSLSCCHPYLQLNPVCNFPSLLHGTNTCSAYISSYSYTIYLVYDSYGYNKLVTVALYRFKYQPRLNQVQVPTCYVRLYQVVTTSLGYTKYQPRLHQVLVTYVFTMQQVRLH